MVQVTGYLHGSVWYNTLQHYNWPISHFQVVLQRNLPGTPDEEEEKGPLQLEAQHIQIIQIVVVFLLILAV